jgi:hypothetical protein
MSRYTAYRANHAITTVQATSKISKNSTTASILVRRPRRGGIGTVAGRRACRPIPSQAQASGDLDVDFVDARAVRGDDGITAAHL